MGFFASEKILLPFKRGFECKCNLFQFQLFKMLQINSNNRKRASEIEIESISDEFNKKPAAKRNNKEGQEKHKYKKKALAEIDDRLKWTDCYADDIYEYWKGIELKLPLFDLTCESFTWRSHQVVELKYLMRIYCYSNLTLHLAIHILDVFLSKTKITKDEIELTVITCFKLAAKVEQDEAKIPSLKQLNESLSKMKSGREYSLQEYESFEVKILLSLEFDLTPPTVATFANFYSRSTVSFEDFHTFNEKTVAAAVNGLGSVSGLYNSQEHMLTVVNNLMFHLVDITSEIAFLRNILRSQLAAACVFAARCLTKINPNWSLALESLTQYVESDIVAIGKTIIEIYTKKLIT